MTLEQPRIDEIKDKLRRYDATDHITEMHKPDGILVMEGTAAEDIRFLLSRLEIAEKALEEAKDKTSVAVNKMCGGSVERHIFEDTRSAYYAINEALQQIRS